MKMKPMGDQILLKKKEGQETTKSGIILTSGTKNYEYADVIAVGPGIFTQTGDRIKMTCKVGDVVLLHARLLKGDNEITLDDQKYVLVRESEISMVSNN
jgi:chaperonin GroES|tara:strand:+ start:50 stop:346 length:297 start_codon:yes stop_codon:yes gene_type:complete